MEKKIMELGKHRLLRGDSSNKEDVEFLMGGEKADLFLVDPPYGVSYIEKNAAVHGGIVKNMVGKKIHDDQKDIKQIKKTWLAIAKNAHQATTNEASYLWFAC